MRSTTGRNLRRILLLTDKSDVENINQNDFKNIEYNQLGEADKWKVTYLKELINIKFGRLQIENFVPEEIEETNHFVSSQHFLEARFPIDTFRVFPIKNIKFKTQK